MAGKRITIDSYERHLHLECRRLARSGVEGNRGIPADGSRLNCCGWVEVFDFEICSQVFCLVTHKRCACRVCLPLLVLVPLHLGFL